jgi:hypothetical protein
VFQRPAVPNPRRAGSAEPFEARHSGWRGMADSRVESWQQAGNLYLWRYAHRTKNYPGWNLAADETGWKSLFDLLGRMAASPLACRREISVIKPTARILAVPNNPAGSEGVESAQCLILEVPRGRVGDRQWRLDSDLQRVVLEVGPSKLAEVHGAVGSMHSTGGDFAIGPDDRIAWKETALWLWLVPKM